MMTTDQVGAVIALHFDRIGIDEVSVSFEHRYIVAPKLGLDHLDLAEHHGLRAKGQVCHRNAILKHVPAAIERALPEAAQIQNSLARRWRSAAGSGDTPSLAICVSFSPRKKLPIADVR